MHCFTATDDAYIVANYASLGPRGCGKHLNKPHQAIAHRRKQLGIPPIPRGEARNRMLSAGSAHTDIGNERPISLQDFQNPTTPEIAYILGLLWADGYIHPSKVVLTCLRKDALDYMDTFDKIGTWRHSERQPARYGVLGQPMRTIYKGHVLLANYLIGKGYASKSHNSACDILRTIPVHLHCYWFRGLLDGDGYLSYSKRGMVWIKITSTFKQRWDYLERLCSKLGIRFQIERDQYVNRHGKTNSRSVFKINNAAGVKAFCEYIYQNRDEDKIGLNRKHAKWIEMAAFMKTRPRMGKLFR